MKPLYLFPLTLLLLAAGCKKEPKTEVEKLPKATQEGKNTAGFLLDGRAWLPKGDDLSAGPTVAAEWRRTVAGRTLRVGFVRRSDDTDAGFFVPDIRRPGTFRLDQRFSLALGDRNPANGGYNEQKAFPNGYYFTGPDAPGELVVTRFDTVAGVVSGTFEMRVREPNTGQTHQLTHGRFDARF
ncbi:hypothetical protein EJV47_16130 [Hymenobacter gummosus]|uniref:Lipoprotein n=1 Tax=Hymenobacter gummosus TaxID=1776032 RepID=A0A431U0Q2_9BACT|nr:hypothetical protein [Hymenobacter gummosus]RTQ48498.1 hypothetical protein EJV47_16130 [Hymenobacter gummosus]